MIVAPVVLGLTKFDTNSGVFLCQSVDPFTRLMAGVCRIKSPSFVRMCRCYYPLRVFLDLLCGVHDNYFTRVSCWPAMNRNFVAFFF